MGSAEGARDDGAEGYQPSDRAYGRPTTGVPVHIERRLTAPSDRTTKRLIIASVLILAIGIPLTGVLYLLDQYHPAGPSLIDRDIAVAEEAVTKNPNLLIARLTLAGEYVRAGRLDDAVTQYDEILKAQPDARAALLGRGGVLISLDRLDAAASDFQTVVDAAKDGEMANVDPELESAHFGLGVIALKQGRSEDAVTELASAVQIKRTDADALNMLGTALLQAGEPERAVTATRQAIALVPVGWCEPYAQLETAYTSLGDAAGAGYAAGMNAFCEGRRDEARAKLGAATTSDHAIDALIGLGLVAEVENDQAAAVDAYGKVLAMDPKNFAANTGMGRIGGVPSGEPPAQPSDGPTGGG